MTKIGLTCDEEVHTPLHFLRRHSVNSAFVREEQVTDCSSRHTRLPTVEKVPVSSVGDSDPRALITLASGQNHVGCSADSSEAILAFKEHNLLLVTVQTIRKDTGEDIGGEVEQRVASLVITEFETTVRSGQLSDAEMGAAAGDLVYLYYVHDLVPQTRTPEFHTTGD
ncbi:unnamed protein product [Schistocephalus solidus]|uniref:Uncharacterized protein n=1 Tax=Schistocephalus solidus TaxID=70667 RepID=A0A183SRX6_SCHSO|nr:unnamed protein product [Schistocephalus solidus]